MPRITPSKVEFDALAAKVPQSFYKMVSASGGIGTYQIPASYGDVKDVIVVNDYTGSTLIANSFSYNASTRTVTYTVRKVSDGSAYTGNGFEARFILLY